MTKLQKIKEILMHDKKQLKRDYKVNKIGIFGSYIRGEAKSKSDLDILVEFAEPISLFKFMDLEDHLHNKLQVKIDLVSKKALRPYISKYILKEVKYI
ncbi:MAG: nucleotidyltransferase family protein [bacterium]|nr:nucleotidyltransferase family protein [bacterium]MDD5757319.1 nucleotidyltransferase family protein [bacterium]